MWNAREVVREVDGHDFRMAREQQLLHLYGGLLEVSPGAVGVRFPVEDRLRNIALTLCYR
jgi:hypothetical protein